MYGWIWRHLPGGVAAKLAAAVLLLAAAVAVLFLVVFPYAEPRLPFNQTTVDPVGGGPAGGGVSDNPGFSSPTPSPSR